MTVRGPLGRVAWTAEYVEFVPPHATITGTEARFVDVQVAGPFKRWRHTHEFEALDSRTTRCVDHIDYAVPLGPLAWVGDFVLVRPSLRRCSPTGHEDARGVRLIDPRIPVPLPHTRGGGLEGLNRRSSP
jgi:ligand-binding SRPBCC domain-containing protein